MGAPRTPLPVVHTAVLPGHLMLPLDNALSKEEVFPPWDSASLAQLAGAHALQQADMYADSLGCSSDE